MNSKGINRNVWALTLSLCLGVIGYSTLSAQAAEQKQQGVKGLGAVGVETEKKGAAPAAATQGANTADLLANACKGKKTGDTVKVGGKDVKCPPRIGVRDPGTPADIKFIEALAAACKGKKTGDTVKVGGKDMKCPAGITNINHVDPAGRIACSPSSSWPGWSRCCSYHLTEYMGWQVDWCAWMQN